MSDDFEEAMGKYPCEYAFDCDPIPRIANILISCSNTGVVGISPEYRLRGRMAGGPAEARRRLRRTLEPSRDGGEASQIEWIEMTIVGCDVA